MKVIVEDISTVKKTLHIELPAEKVSGELDDAYAELKKTAKIKGFRPGKAPTSMIKRVYQKDVEADVTSKLIQESIFKAIEDNHIKIIAPPRIDPPELKKDQPYSYDATVEIYPEIQNIDFKGLPLKKTIHVAGENEVELQLKMIQKNMAVQKPIDDQRPVQADDFVLIHYEGFKDGQPFDETKRTENFTLKIGAGTILKEFDDQLIGMKTGDTREITVTFPADYFNPKLAGLTIAFNVELVQIREEVLPEINDDFAAKLGPYTTLDEVKALIRKNLESGYNRRSEQELNEQIFQALIEKTKFEVPDALIDMELNSIMAEAEQSLSYQNMTFEQLGMTKESFSDKYRDTAEKQVRRHLILNHIIEQEKLELTDDEFDSGVAEMAENVNQPADDIKRFYTQNPDKKENFTHTLLEKKAISLIISSSNVENVQPEMQVGEETAEK